MAEKNINWESVAKYLKHDAEGIRQRAQSAFSSDLQTQQEMRTRASLLESFAEAINFGLS